MQRIIFYCLLLLWFSHTLGTSCKKEEVRTLYRDTTVSGNTIPPYDGVSEVKLQSYINRLYIDLVGRTPADAELTDAVQTLQENPQDENKRKNIARDLISTMDYHKRFFEKNAAAMLNGLDSAEVRRMIVNFNQLITNAKQEGQTGFAAALELELDKIIALLNVRDNYRSGSTDLNGYMAVMVNNYFYDQINMGSENFVKACFENLLHRAPTTAELQASIKMVDNQASAVFLADGTSKGDFIDIFTHCREFYQGQVITAYQTYLLREPGSAEAGTDTDLLASGQSLETLVLNLVTSDEYAGF